MTPLPPTRERPTILVPPGAGGPGPPAPRSRRRKAVRIFLFSLLILLAVALGVAAAAVFLLKSEVDDLLTPTSAKMIQAQKELEEPLPGEPANILVLGSDHRKGTGDEDRRSDTLMIVRLDPDNKSVSMLSFPRDLFVNVPGHGEAKINDAYYYGGPQLSVKTVTELTGLDINYIVDVDFGGFRGIINQLGGVYVDVDHRYLNDPAAGGGNYAEIDIEPGYQLLYGKDALAYARYRHGDSDFHRIARQQLLLGALKKQVSGSSIAGNVPGLFKVVNKNTEMAVGGEGNVSARQIIEYIRLALELEGDSVYQVEVEGDVGTSSGGASIVVADQARIDAAVDAFEKPDNDARERTADQVTGETKDVGADPETGAPPASETTVEVKNGNGIAGAATETGNKLRELGYKVVVKDGDAGAADNPNYANTRVQYNDEKNKAAAEVIAENFPDATVEEGDSSNPFRTQVLVIVGAPGAGDAATTDDTVSGDTHESNKVPEKAAPKIVTDPAYGKEDFHAISGMVKFPILYPTIREESSTYQSIDDGGAVRAYKIAKGESIYDAYRLVAQTGAGDYWGLQGTTWPDPPLLDDPTRETIRQGRTYKLYFNGTRLHIVAWREGKGTYWVSNSVLDKLSNETMMSIAQGVRKLRR